MMYQLQVPERLDGRQWKSILRTEFGASARLLGQIVRNQAVTVNGESVYLTARAKSGDVLTLELPKESSSVQPETGPLSIAYEDDEVLVANKAPGVLTHPSAREKHGSLLAFAAAYLQRSAQVPHCVHRLDRDTSGVVMLAKHAHFHHLYDVALRRGLVHRTYVAIVQAGDGADGQLSDRTWKTIDLPVGGDPDEPSKRVVSADGQSAITHYRVLATANPYALVAVVLETGRTHQIRLHFAAIGLPLAGEPHYRADNAAAPSGGLIRRRPPGGLSRQALHAAGRRWENPITGERRRAVAAIPQDMAQFWQQSGGSADDFERIFDLSMDFLEKQE